MNEHLEHIDNSSSSSSVTGARWKPQSAVFLIPEQMPIWNPPMERNNVGVGDHDFYCIDSSGAAEQNSFSRSKATEAQKLQLPIG